MSRASGVGIRESDGGAMAAAPASRLAFPRSGNGAARSRASFGLMAVLLIVLSVALSMLFAAGTGGADAMQSREGGTPASGTPVAAESGTNDPLDGDPLDGPPRTDDSDEPEDLTQYEFTRSGRPAGAPQSLTAYDGDSKTAWSVADATETWIWFDLGEERPLREVRWLTSGAGTIEVAVSADREEWSDVGEREVDPGWQSLDAREEARYVRLTLVAEEEGSVPPLAEVAAYGPDRAGGVALEQRARNDKRETRRDSRDNSRRNRATDRETERTRERGRGDASAESRPGITAEPGETRCEGNRAKCRAKPGRVSVEEDCQSEGTCAIDVRADGGTAICEASAGDENKAGRGSGRRDGDGGECEAVANGGVVTIGDIDP